MYTTNKRYFEFKNQKMNYKVTHTFNFPLSELLRAREDRYKNLDKFPDLRNVTLVEERKEGKNIFQKRKIGI